MTKKIFDRAPKKKASAKKPAKKPAKQPKVPSSAQLLETAKSELEAEFKKNVRDIALKALGFNNSWGDGWAVDHCNGRMSELTSWIKVRAEDIIEHLDLDKELVLSAAEKKKLKSRARAELLSEIESVVSGYESVATEHAVKIVHEELESILAEGTFRKLVRAKLQGIADKMIKDMENDLVQEG